MATLETIEKSLGDCKRCKLCETRTNIVFGHGDPNAKWVFIGEAPGAEEDLCGLPFVGRSGRLLTDLINETGWGKESVYIMNILGCRPPANRVPQTNEVEACSPFLYQKLSAINPAVITTLGTSATKFLLKNVSAPISKLRGSTIPWSTSVVVPTYHPSYVIRRNNRALEDIRADLGLAVAELVIRGIGPIKSEV
jgi:DNA polymerase